MADPHANPEPDLLDHAPPGAMCLGCRYDISGMDIRAKCPECGDRVAPSVNFIGLEYAPLAFLQALNDGTRQAHQAGLTAIAGLAVLCTGYTLGNKGVLSNVSLLGTLLGGAMLLVATLLAARASLRLTSVRLPGEEQKIRTLRKALPICAFVAVAIALGSTAIFMLSATGQIHPGQHRSLSLFLVLWMAFPFVPIYTIFYLQMLADRSRVLSARVLMALGTAGFLAMMLMPAAIGSAGTALFALFGIQVAQRSPGSNFLPFDAAYVWPLAIGINITLALVAIAYFRRRMDFAPTSEDQPHEPPRS